MKLLIATLLIGSQASAQYIDPKYDAFGGYRPQRYQPSSMETFLMMQNAQMQKKCRRVQVNMSDGQVHFVQVCE